MKLTKICFKLLGFGLLFFFTHVFANPAEVLSFLNQYDSIRVAAVAAHGNGHQALAITIIKKLRALGYRGKIEFVYDVYDKKKIEYLLPPFDSTGPDSQFIRGLDVETHSYSDSFYMDANFKKIPLTIVSAKNGYIHRARFFNSDYVLYFCPPHWDSVPFIISQNIKNLSIIKDDYPLKTEMRPIGELAEFLSDEMSHSQKLAHKIDGLRSLIEAAQSKQIHLISAYGLGFAGVDRLVHLVKSLLRAQELNQSFPKNVVIGLISNLNAEEWDAVTLKLSGLKWQVSDIKDAKLSSGVSIVKIGNVTQEVWGLLMKESTLPPLAAGSNGVDFLFQTGKPFLITIMSQLGGEFKFDSKLTDIDNRRFVKGFLDHNIQFIYLALELGDLDTVAHFYIESLDSQSPLNKNFARFSQIRSRLPDRLCATLLEVKKVLKGQEDKPLNAFVKRIKSIAK